MQRFTDFMNKYGIIIHSLSIILWLWTIKLNFDKIQKDGSVSKTSLYIGFALLTLSTFNLIFDIKKKLKKS